MRSVIIILAMMYSESTFGEDRLFCPYSLAQSGRIQQPQSDGPGHEASPAQPQHDVGDDQSSSTCEDRWSSFLPIWGRDACERGYVLPRPFGISIGYMRQDQLFDVGGVFINGVDIEAQNFAVVNEVSNAETTGTARFDVWILPFWNVYGVLGKTVGRVRGPLRINLDPVFPVLCSIPNNNCQIDTTFDIDYTADVRGFGSTLAGSYGDFFGLLDWNHTKADLDISVSDAEATVISARLGRKGKVAGFSGVLWIGAMYQDIEQTIDLQSEIDVDELLISIDQSTQVSINYIAGAQWDVNPSFSFLAE